MFHASQRTSGIRVSNLSIVLSGIHHLQGLWRLPQNSLPIAIFVGIHAVLGVILHKKQKRRNPELPMSYVAEIFFCQPKIRSGQRRFIGRPYLGGHAPINIDGRVVRQRIIGKESSARLQSPMHLGKQRGAILHMVDGVRDINKVVGRLGRI